VVLMLVSIPFIFITFAVHELGHVIVLRRRKIGVTGVSLFGIHGETSYNEYAAKPGDAVAVAWGGVAAQLLLMLLALGLTWLVPFAAIPFGSELAAVMFVVLVKLNIFIMIIALLPIGPFDGHAAWQVIPRMRARFKRPRKAKPARATPSHPSESDVRLSEEEQRELDKSSERAAADLMAKLTRRSDANAGDDPKE
jgi:Zn-dependent protease